MIPVTNVPAYPYHMGNPYISPISTMGTLLGVHPIVPWIESSSENMTIDS